MRRLVVILFLLAWAGDTHASAFFTATPVPLGSGLVPGIGSGKLIFKGALLLASDDARFGGLSGLIVDDTLRVTAVSDRGYFVEFELFEGEDGTLIGAGNLTISAMSDTEGALLRGTDRDAEDITLLPSGDRIVVFERNPRLVWFPPGATRAKRTVSLLDLVPGSNEDIEAITVLRDGRLLLIGEDLLKGEIRPAWIGSPGEWMRLDYLPEADQGVSGAARLPGGDVLVLERSAAPLRGYQTRLRRVSGAAVAPGALLVGETLLVLEPCGLSDNFEAVATRPLPDDRAAVYLLSDDNYFPLQRTLLLKFETAP